MRHLGNDSDTGHDWKQEQRLLVNTLLVAAGLVVVGCIGGGIIGYLVCQLTH